ncbi:hypothetical protein SAMN05216326_103133 [Nitrosomonas marina]|uniref:Uncharacterized protein n=1 Tax=Nitrosomonas marina TaxID=917 RepID=A0A1H9Z8C3_9PROT|nr:hypothetical protein [Nitrosomonas marina]SES77759.1 hypothetical protein SAMN05216326_103133 [Nitrosomonas marina]
MQNGTTHFFTAFVLFAFTYIALPMNAFAAEQNDIANTVAMENAEIVDHAALARHHEEQANEMYAKIEEQIEALKERSRSSFLGKHGRDIKKHVKHKIQEYEKAAEENLEQAAYHRKMAEEQSSRPVFADSGNTKS